MSAALAILDPEERKACDRIRSVRNALAHSIKVIDFDTPEVANECARLDPQKLLPADVTYQGESNSARERFRIAGLLISNHLMEYLQAAVKARKAAGF